MKPTRAAWFFVAGLAWLVLRGILVQSLPQIRTDEVAQHGGLLLVVPMISVVASLTAPLFFFSFLRHHRFGGQRFLRFATVVAAVASLLSSFLALAALVTAVAGIRPPDLPFLLASPKLLQATLLVLVGSFFLFLLAFARSSACTVRLRRAAAVGATGAMISAIMVVVWVVHFRFPDQLDWYPAVSGNPVSKMIGLAAAGTFLWFLETFATSYGDGDHDEDLD
jgi:hypothetical protein